MRHGKHTGVNEWLTFRLRCPALRFRACAPIISPPALGEDRSEYQRRFILTGAGELFGNGASNLHCHMFASNLTRFLIAHPWPLLPGPSQSVPAKPATTSPLSFSPIVPYAFRPLACWRFRGSEPGMGGPVYGSAFRRPILSPASRAGCVLLTWCQLTPRGGASKVPSSDAQGPDALAVVPQFSEGRCLERLRRYDRSSLASSKQVTAKRQHDDT